MDLRAFDPETVADVTDELADANPRNRLYRLPSGQVVKIKTDELKHKLIAQNARVFLFTASCCDAAGQKLPDAPIQAPPHQVTTHLHPLSPPHGVQLEKVRRQFALWWGGPALQHDEDIPGVVARVILAEPVAPPAPPAFGDAAAAMFGPPAA